MYTITIKVCFFVFVLWELLPGNFRSKLKPIFYIFGLRHSPLLQGTEIQVTASFWYRFVSQGCMPALDTLDVLGVSHLLLS